jgi:hypothetical protein
MNYNLTKIQMRYIVSYSIRSDGPQCNTDAKRVFESDRKPTPEMLRRNYIIATGGCTNLTYPGCEDCSGARLTKFEVEPYTEERAEELGLTDQKIRELRVDSS